MYRVSEPDKNMDYGDYKSQWEALGRLTRMWDHYPHYIMSIYQPDEEVELWVIDIHNALNPTDCNQYLVKKVS